MLLNVPSALEPQQQLVQRARKDSTLMDQRAKVIKHYTILFYMMKLLLFYNFMNGCNYKSNSGVNLLSPNHTSNIT